MTRADSNTENQQRAYDSVPYESHCYRKTHPSHIRVNAEIFGLKTADHKSARILEIGCAGGGNILPLALKHPDSDCVGIDISGQQIAIAQDQADKLGLKNITFKQADIAEPQDELGQFDYIICHGVYSWVPPHVREAVMKQCRALLKDDGLAVISYNTLPGWNTVRSMRDMMLFHTQNFEDPAQKVAEARSILNFVQQNAPEDKQLHKGLIEQEIQILEKADNSHLFHDYLETENHQFYFKDFIAHAEENDLSYVADTELSTMFLKNFNETVMNTLAGLNDLIKQEQYIDFLTNRRFRQTILTPSQNADNINRNISRDIVANYSVRALFQADPQAEIQGTPTFTRGEHMHFDVQNPIMRTSLMKLAEKTTGAPLEEIINKTKIAMPAAAEDQVESIIKNNMIEFVLKSLVELSADDCDAPETLSDKPKSYALAQLQAQHSIELGLDKHTVTTLTHDSVHLDTSTATLLTLLDGQADKASLLASVKELIKDKKLVLKQGERDVENIDQALNIAEGFLNAGLESFLMLNLLEG